MSFKHLLDAQFTTLSLSSLSDSPVLLSCLSHLLGSLFRVDFSKSPTSIRVHISFGNIPSSLSYVI